MRFPRSTQSWAFLLLGPFVLLWIIAAGYYAIHPFFLDHLESSVTVAAEQWIQGRPLYHSLDSSYLYSMLYGPICYVWVAFFLRICPDPILASKLAGAASGFAALGLLAWTFRRCWPWQIAGAALGMVCCELLFFNEYSFWDRADPILLFAATLGLAALVVKDRRLGFVILTMALAFALDGKIHGGFYLLPVLTIWCRRQGWLSTGIVLATAGVGSLLIFLLPGISLRHYVIWLHEATAHPIHAYNFQLNVASFAALLLPVGIFGSVDLLRFRKGEVPEQTLMLIVLVFSGLVICVPASKMGAGTWHLMPFVPLIGYLFGMALADMPPRPQLTPILLVALVWISASLLHATREMESVLVAKKDRGAEDLRQLLRKYPANEMQMGAGSNSGYETIWSAPLIYRSAVPCVVNAGAYMDMQESGLGTQALQKSLTEETFRYWLIPRDEIPFSLSNGYNAKPLFDEIVQKAFSDHYRKMDTSAFFDVYQAK